MKKQQIVSYDNIEQKSISVNYGLCASILQSETVCLSSLDIQFLHVPFYCIISLISKCATQNGPRGLIWCSFGWLGLGTRCLVSPLLDHHRSAEITIIISSYIIRPIQHRDFNLHLGFMSIFILLSPSSG